MQPLHFLTWTTYGTWLPGDQRGWASAHTHQPQPPSYKLEKYAAARLVAPPMVLEPRQRVACAAALEEACVFRGWTLGALNVRSTHVHALIAADESSQRVLQVLKARATRCMREAGLTAADRPIWASSGSMQLVWNPDQAAAVVGYILDEQGESLAGATRGPAE